MLCYKLFSCTSVDGPMKSNPCYIVVNPHTPKFQCCLWPVRLGPVDKKWQKIKPWTQRKLDTVLFNIEIWGVGFYFVAVCRVWLFCPSTVSCCYFLLRKISANGTYTGSLAQDILYRYPCKGIAHSSFYRDPVKEILRTILYSSQRELAEDTLVFVSRSLQLVSLAGIIRMVCPPSHIITVCRKNSRTCRKWANCLWSWWWWWWWWRNKGNKGL